MLAYLGNKLMDTYQANYNVSINPVTEYSVYYISLQECGGGICQNQSTITIAADGINLTVGNYYYSFQVSPNVFVVDSGPVNIPTPPDDTITAYTDITGVQDTYCCL